MRHDSDDEPTVAGIRPTPERRKSGRGRHARRSRVRPWISAVMASSVVLTIGVLAINTFVRPVGLAAADPGSLVLTDAERAAADQASREFARPDPTPSTPALPAVGLLVPPQGGAAQAAAALPATRAPVAGLNQDQMDHAVVIVEVGKRMNLPKRASVVALVTVLQETRLRNLANKRVPQSLDIPNEGVGSDFDSVGLFQQRPSQGWGTAAELMDPATAAGRFYARLAKVPGWEKKSVGDAAQAVQRSAFPNAYAQHQPQAQKIVDAIF
ncbi:hypothetical protein HC028_04830 [Planosporangium flavigriseum]|uniref:Transglycosylase SLT domain-containing protein n=1 Tax=Planosporangium flavigriseum TaxID=373681 RepID=A0A8J3LNH1_9ACTN|nr:hypothetical protein [Planosporangium flavigriseum]NJC63834.1 hypothetical protein [Planosporangium flavigriseum]GIG75942.1 hypothetical protein Pfl04_43460 [Planosporangium flavigriseum]